MDEPLRRSAMSMPVCLRPVPSRPVGIFQAQGYEEPHLMFVSCCVSKESTHKKHINTKNTLCYPPNPPTNIVGFRGFDSSMMLIERGGIPRPIGDFPESLSQAMLLGTMLVGRLGVHPVRIARIRSPRFAPRGGLPRHPLLIGNNT